MDVRVRRFSIDPTDVDVQAFPAPLREAARNAVGCPFYAAVGCVFVALTTPYHGAV
jgi:hypothetical protein